MLFVKERYIKKMLLNLHALKGLLGFWGSAVGCALLMAVLLKVNVK